MRSLIAVCSVVFLGVASHASAASLVFDSVLNISGTGLGAVPTVLTVQGGNGALAEQEGCVSWNGTADVTGATACVGTGSSGIDGGDEKEQTQTRLLTAALGGTIDSVSDFSFVFNIAETGQDKSVDLQQLCANFFSSTGALLLTACTGNLGDTALLGTATGTGGSGLLFRLEGVTAAEATAILAAGVRVGAITDNGSFNNGQETIWLYNRNQTVITPDPAVPEPGSLILLGSGLAAAASAVRRRRAKK